MRVDLNQNMHTIARMHMRSVCQSLRLHAERFPFWV